MLLGSLMNNFNFERRNQKNLTSFFGVLSAGFLGTFSAFLGVLSTFFAASPSFLGVSGAFLGASGAFLGVSGAFFGVSACFGVLPYISCHFKEELRNEIFSHSCA